MTDLREALRIPALISHFMEHRTNEINMSFTDFLKLHYATEQSRDVDGDRDKDNRLPFKTNHTEDQLVLQKIHIPHCSDFIFKAYETEAPMASQAKPWAPWAAFPKGIWRPPRTV
jgi:hypothetical protein